MEPMEISHIDGIPLRRSSRLQQFSENHNEFMTWHHGSPKVEKSRSRNSSPIFVRSTSLSNINGHRSLSVTLSKFEDQRIQNSPHNSLNSGFGASNGSVFNLGMLSLLNVNSVTRDVPGKLFSGLDSSFKSTLDHVSSTSCATMNTSDYASSALGMDSLCCRKEDPDRVHGDGIRIFSMDSVVSKYEKCHGSVLLTAQYTNPNYPSDESISLAHRLNRKTVSDVYVSKNSTVQDSVNCLLLKTTSDDNIAEKNIRRPHATIFNSECKLLVKLHRFICLLFKVTLWSILTLLTLLSLSWLAFTHQYHQDELCKIALNTTIEVDLINRNLQQVLVGQPLAVRQMAHALQLFQPEQLPEGVLLMWLVGSSGVGKTFAIQQLVNFLSPAYHVQTLFPAFIHADRVAAIVATTEESMEDCGPNVVIVDGWDDEDDAPLAILAQLVSRWRSRWENRTPKGRFLVIISGTQGSEVIYQTYIDARRTGLARMEMASLVFIEKIMKTHEYFLMLNVNLNQIVVPFLPMEQEEVQSCIVQSLATVHYGTDDKGNANLNSLVPLDSAYLEIVSKVIQFTKFMPQDFPIVASTGCKRVPSLLRLLRQVPAVPINSE